MILGVNLVVCFLRICGGVCVCVWINAGDCSDCYLSSEGEVVPGVVCRLFGSFCVDLFSFESGWRIGMMGLR